ncbi:23S rRNA (cytosine1962-C5)-methyltransferase [Anaerobranca californiensis DSM 14826]|uniref:23S rRNA (Cytosine1962-C5)-methyltransferase n=1 Tax=Anaerobranca californiensis DSM 14826 TaxID=1120989 RepID=A0A1M6RTJ3_9FIRM|nr:class I SAM-dependent rRNA methyltransferase [Anaerobranca californiensis]SHK35688.1 23S rRNA (cytosine1962-C5)-methyltransferase [Anaerobranca californiensis DSM 14826]
MTKVYLKIGEQKRIIRGHRWIYSNEIEKIEGEYKPGDIVDVYDFKNRFIGRGYINPKSKITVRLFTYRQEEINREFFKRKIEEAWQYRQKIMDTNCCRVIFGEGDFLPGLIVDKFGDYLVIQTLALGIDIHKKTIVELLDEIISPKGIYERNDVQIRELEGLKEQKGYLKGNFPTKVQIIENGIKMWVDLENGQKTGYFLDQKENRLAIAPFVKDGEVLDCFSHTGSFTLHACQFGAKHVTAVDISEHAIETIKENVLLNGFENKVDYRLGNAFDILRELQREGKKFDVTILDPPAFAKSKKALKGAIRGYKDINLRGMKITKNGGFLVTASCSHYMSPELFMEVIKDAAQDADKILRQVEFRTQSKDHPIVLNADESLYLKFGIFQVLDR